MKQKELLKKLTDFLDGEGRKKRKHQAELRELLRQLKEKEAQLEEKRLAEGDKNKQKRLDKKLEIVKAQYAKGLETLESLESS